MQRDKRSSARTHDILTLTRSTTKEANESCMREPANQTGATSARASTMISARRKLVTLINVFTVKPANQRQLLELLARATETSVRHAQGFISASLHRSLDGTKVTMYAQWRSIEDYQAMRENPAPLPYLQQALAFAKFEPGMYEVVETFSAGAGDA